MPTVLYAEDDPEHRLMVRIILKDTDITLIEAVDGLEALQKIRNHHPDLVLVDLFMPRLDGYGLMKAIKADPATARIPIVVVSAWPTGDNQTRAKQAGAVEFVVKPYKPDQLGKLIKRYVSSQTGLELTKPKPDITLPRK
jgi:CheY-like chemotaxis protein